MRRERHKELEKLLKKESDAILKKLSKTDYDFWDLLYYINHKWDLPMLMSEAGARIHKVRRKRAVCK